MTATIISSLALVVSACSLVVSYFAWRSKERERQPRLWVRFERFDTAGWWIARISIDNPSLVGLAPQRVEILAGGMISSHKGGYAGPKSGPPWLSDQIEQAGLVRSHDVSKQGSIAPSDDGQIRLIVKSTGSPVRFRLDCLTIEAEPKRQIFAVVGHLPKSD